MSIHLFWCRKPVTNHRHPLTTTQKIGILALLLLGGSLVAKATTLARLQFVPRSIADISFKDATPVMRLIVGVVNTSNQALTLNSLYGSVSATMNGGKYVIGSIYSFEAQTIQPNSETLVAINIRLSALQIINQIINIFSGAFGSSVITLEGSANIDKYQIPLNLNFELGG